MFGGCGAVWYYCVEYLVVYFDFENFFFGVGYWCVDGWDLGGLEYFVLGDVW